MWAVDTTMDDRQDVQRPCTPAESQTMIKNRNQLIELLQLLRRAGPRRPMTPTQYKAAIAAVGLSQERAGIFFGYSKRPGQSWALGERAVPWAVQCALEFMVDHSIDATAFEAE
jgi:hypothetical protein